MKRLLLITGDIASGKTTFSRLLSARCGTAAFQKDTVKEILGDRIAFRDRAENKQLSLATVDVMIHVFSVLARGGVPLILEANFSADELERLHGVAERNGYEVLTLELRGETETLYRRYLRRAELEHRHPVHLSAPLQIREEFERYIENGRSETVPGERIGIDATDFAYQTDAALLERIDRFFTEEKT